MDSESVRVYDLVYSDYCDGVAPFGFSKIRKIIWIFANGKDISLVSSIDLHCIILYNLLKDTKADHVPVGYNSANRITLAAYNFYKPYFG